MPADAGGPRGTDAAAVRVRGRVGADAEASGTGRTHRARPAAAPDDPRPRPRPARLRPPRDAPAPGAPDRLLTAHRCPRVIVPYLVETGAVRAPALPAQSYLGEASEGAVEAPSD